MKSVDISGKVGGVVSVGAKRNGGQETCNIFTMYDLLRMRCAVVGNGPKTSQYGGTVWAGDKGTIREDNYGIESCIATGMNVSRTAELVNPGGEVSGSLNISFIAPRMNVQSANT